MNLHTCILIGLLGSITMFMGDMFLYYDRKDYDKKDKINSIVGIMKNLGTKRLYLGGILGPLGSFLYLLGSYHMVLASQEKFLKLAWILFLINSLGIIFGGAYHLQFAYLGLLSRHEGKEAFDEFLKFLKFQAKIVFEIMAIANIALALVILFGFTVFPRWQALFTPIFLLIFTPIVDRLPKGLHMIVRGGWLNIIYFIYYLSLLINYTNINL